MNYSWQDAVAGVPYPKDAGNTLSEKQQGEILQAIADHLNGLLTEGEFITRVISTVCGIAL